MFQLNKLYDFRRYFLIKMNEDVIVPKQQRLHKYYILFQLNRIISEFVCVENFPF